MNVIVAGGGTGGHLMPALALADELASRGLDPVLVGAERGLEARLLPDHTPAYPFHLLPVFPIYRRQWWRNLALLRTVPRLWRACTRVLDETRPAMVISTGGYAAGPIAWRAARRGVPLVLQEQNALPGITTRWLTRYARQIHLGFPEGRDRLAPTSAEIFSLGNPVAVQGADRETARTRLGIPPDVPVILVLCGSQGARAVNEVVATILRNNLLPDTHLLWACGHGNVAQAMPFHDPPRVIVKPFWSPVADAYAAADLAVTRAGAMTSADLHASGLPAIMIPLPTAAEGHQRVNARALEEAGASICVEESEVSASSLTELIRGLLADPGRLAAMSEVAKSRANPAATREIVDRIVTLLD